MRLGVASAAKQQQTDVRYLSSLSRRRAESSGALPRTRELSFATDVDATLDLCAWPSLHSLHSAFFSDTRSIQHLYPLFSPSKPSGFADLLIPFHQYWSPPSEVLYENEYRKGRTKEPADLDWENKDDKVFWRGKITRGADTPAGHAESFQKARLVALANDDGSTWVGKEGDPNRKRVKPKIAPHRVLVTVNATSSSLVSMSAPGPKINEYTMDVAMACDAQLGECAEQIRLGYKVTNPGPLSEAWQHRYVVDLDEVGLSSRFPALMESKSAVIRSSVQHEFWQDWIVPWYHYIPLSTSYAELFNIQAFFSGFPKALQNRRSTAASAPQKDESGDEFAETEDVDVSILSGPSQEGDDGAQTTQAGEVTLRSESISLKPINPAHGDSFDGNLALKDIADAGSQWRTTHMRREDMEVCPSLMQAGCTVSILISSCETGICLPVVVRVRSVVTQACRSTSGSICRQHKQCQEGINTLRAISGLFEKCSNFAGCPGGLSLESTAGIRIFRPLPAIVHSHRARTRATECHGRLGWQFFKVVQGLCATAIGKPCLCPYIEAIESRMQRQHVIYSGQ